MVERVIKLPAPLLCNEWWEINIEKIVGGHMIEFWMDQPPLFIHRLARGEYFEGPRFATIDEGDEVTVISSKAGKHAAGPYVCITMGPFDLDLIGILARASVALEGEKVPIFVLSTYRHDHILVPLEMTGNAVKALTGADFSHKK